MKPDWIRIAAGLDETGYAVLPLLDPETCQELAALYGQDHLFRSRIVMHRHSFGRGEYKYFGYPLPAWVGELRTSLYPPLAQIANRWSAVIGEDMHFPADLDAYLAQCHTAGQTRPTPLLLRYERGDYNCLHQDLYGSLAFPLQITVLLSAPQNDFTGGEFVLVEQRPRAQSRVEVVPLSQGEAVVFPVHHRPVQGTRGVYRVQMRHGVSRIRSGLRQTLGLIFHDAS